jgi:hypothetical protein
VTCAEEAPLRPGEDEALWRAYRRHAGFGYCRVCEQSAPCPSWTAIRRRLESAGLVLPIIALRFARLAVKHEDGRC